MGGRDRCRVLSLIFSSEGLGSDHCYTQDTELVGSRFLYS